MSAESELPGGDDFHDVTNIFIDAAAEMQPGQVIFREGFTLHDAMSAFEIGEPRLDSGMILQAQHRPPFDPWAPLLPQEICWIIDRSFSYEVLFHAGNPLAHTVFTSLYSLVIHDLHPDMLPYGHGLDAQLISLVLRSSISGMLKCCDLSWRELSKGHMYDTEDWQSDKCDTSLLEAMSVQNVLGGLDNATGWLIRGRQVPEPWLTALVARLNLRKVLLQLMDSNIFRSPSNFMQLIGIARNHLKTVQSYPAPEPATGSVAHLAFDPYIARKLNSSVPIRVIPLPPIAETWLTVEALLDGWEELRLLSLTTTVSTWETAGLLRAWLPTPPLRVPYIRSATQSVFYDGLLVLNKFSPQWVFDRFFYETLGVSQQSVLAFIEQHSSSQWHPWGDLQRGHFKLTTEYIRALWFNPGRRRRFLMKLLVELHTYYAQMVEIQSSMPKFPATEIMGHLPSCALLWRLSVIRDVVLSGFQLELYSAEERPFAYWYLSQVIEAHLECLDELLLALDPGSTPAREFGFQHSFLTALQAMAVPMFILSMPLMSFAWRQMNANFRRRYKWAFSPVYDDLPAVPVVAPPDFDLFMAECANVSVDESGFSPVNSFKLAHTVLKRMIDGRAVGAYAGSWTEDRILLLQNLADASERLSQDPRIPASVEDMPSFDEGLLKWDPIATPSTWFPVVEDDGKERRRNRRARTERKL
ncbi:Mak10 subunit, NatC N-terminal acetyltransferase-domain-containing protein [Mycena amicta]|nr:Mak10 subunit, NatC N-terminal acetyltransferase-domain-containing protein [Mycena amicta]